MSVHGGKIPKRLEPVSGLSNSPKSRERLTKSQCAQWSMWLWAGSSPSHFPPQDLASFLESNNKFAKLNPNFLGPAESFIHNECEVFRPRGKAHVSSSCFSCGLMRKATDIRKCAGNSMGPLMGSGFVWHVDPEVWEKTKPISKEVQMWQFHKKQTPLNQFNQFKPARMQSWL